MMITSSVNNKNHKHPEVYESGFIGSNKGSVKNAMVNVFALNIFIRC